MAWPPRLPSYRRKIFWISLSAFTLLLIFYARSQNQELGTKRGDIIKNDQLYNPEDVAIKLRSNHKQAEYIDKKGVHVVVGRYVGGALKENEPKLLEHELNAISHTNLTSPDAGKDGDPVFAVSPAEEALAKRLWHINKFNVLVSDKIPLNRSLPDIRKPACKALQYDLTSLPKASVIIVFHNEAWSTLLRTVHSVINRSPAELLQEIVLVDDASNRTFLGAPLEDHLRSLELPVQLLRTRQRQGLIKARLQGAERAAGQVLVFLDAHCETTAGWLEPLLYRLAEDRTAVVCPVIDIINDDTFAYTKSFSLHWGAFNWELHFRWFTMSRRVLEEYQSNVTRPYDTPAMAGGLFAMRKAFFYELGSYDEAMDIWGGENLELSFRTWMCGGSVEIAPCSHVGHVFRKASPYTFPREGGVGAVLHSNLARVALVWMDELQHFYFKINPHSREAAAEQDVAKRRELRQALNCKSFQWYLDHVWPEHFFPSQGRTLGKFRHRQTGLCIQKPFTASGTSSRQPSGAAILESCRDDKLYAPQLVILTPKGYIMTDESTCLDSPTGHEQDATVRFQACAEIERQEWTYNESEKTVIHAESGKCLSHPTAGTSDILTLQLCSGKLEQQWMFEPETWH